MQNYIKTHLPSLNNPTENTSSQSSGNQVLTILILAARSRAIPVAMAAGTTILGMIPLIPDPVFGGMAVTIMGGLFIATILTIIILSAFYTIFFGLKKEAL